MPSKLNQKVDTLVLASGGGGIQTESGTVVLAADGMRDSVTTLFNNFEIVTASGFAHASNGSCTLAQNLSSKIVTVPLESLQVGDEIVSFTVKGGLGGTGGNATVVDADLRKVTGVAGGVTDASVAAITQVSVTADTALNSSKTLTTAETVATGYQYYVVITGTTANNAACDIALTGVEVVVNRVV